jgi:hypothetical protein
MSEHEKGHVDCPFSGHDETLINVKFFRGSRNDVITAAEIKEQARSAALQRKLGTAAVSSRAPVSPHPVINVREFVANL